ncbi:hypothetical protein TRVL_00907 [Trypanosoma vivax]|nr:hypothetical protein TRVL_00907 [Trypanosoma vivax]
MRRSLTKRLSNTTGVVGLKHFVSLSFLCQFKTETSLLHERPAFCAEAAGRKDPRWRCEAPPHLSGFSFGHLAIGLRQARLPVNRDPAALCFHLPLSSSPKTDERLQS